MKTIIGNLLETTLAEPVVTPTVEEAPADMVDPAPAEEPTAEPEKSPMAMAAEGCMDPDMMSGGLQAMSDQCEKYFNEADDSTYTCKDMQDKEDIEEARGHIMAAHGLMMGKKK